MKETNQNKEKTQVTSDSTKDFAKDFGKGFGETFGKALGKTIALSVVLGINLFMLFMLNFFYQSIPFATEEFRKWLPFANLSVAVSIILSTAQIFVPQVLLHLFMEIVKTAFSLMGAIALFLIFPFSFETGNWQEFIDKWGIGNIDLNNVPKDQVEFWVKITLIGIIVAISIALIVNSIRFIVKVVKKLVK